MVSGVFRGRPLGTAKNPTMVTPVQPAQPARPGFLPAEAGREGLVAVQADPDALREFAGSNGELVVVIDYSRSMIDNKVPPSNKTRIEVALDALETCLDKLPDGVNLTVLTFRPWANYPSTNSGQKAAGVTANCPISCMASAI